MATIYQVAKQAGVSVATVSRVLTNPSVVREATRERVLAVIDELEYEPNRAAQALRTLKAGKLLITVPDIANPFYSNVIRGAQAAARDAGYAVVLGDSGNDQGTESPYVAMLKRREVDGLIFLGHRIPDSLQKLAAGTTNVPVVNACEFTAELDVSSVHIDNRQAGADMMEYLHSLGHRRIGIIGGPPVGPLSRDRLAGAQASATAHGMTIEQAAGDFTMASGYNAARQLLPRAPTAIFCFNDEMAIGAMAALRAAGLSCPRDVSIVGFDDITFARYACPALTTIRQPAEQIGIHTVEILMKTIDGEIVEPVSITLPHELVVRASASAPAKR